MARPCTGTVLGLLLAALVPAAVADAQPTSDAGAEPYKLGPIEHVTKAGDTLGLRFAAQLRATVSRPDLGESAEPSATLNVRRLRFYLLGAFWEDRLHTFLHISFTPGSPELMDLWAEYRPSPRVGIRVGQHKLPYTAYRDISFQRLVLVDWGIAALAFGSERQLGASLLVHPDGGSGLSGALGVFSGDNARATFASGVAFVNRASLPNRSSLRDPAPTTGVHPELAAGLRHTARGMPTKALRDDKGGPLRHLVDVSAAWDADPDPTQDWLLRGAAEVRLAAHHVAWLSVGYLGATEPLGDGLEPGGVGTVTELDVWINRWVDVAARYSMVHYFAAMRRTAVARAELAAMQDDGPEVPEGVGATRRLEEVAAGINVHAITDQLVWRTDVAGLHTLEVTGGRWGLQARTQVQLAF